MILAGAPGGGCPGASGEELAMSKAIRILFVVLCGIVGGWAGYWIGHLAGWSRNADWPSKIGGGQGAILLSIAVSVLGVALAVSWLTIPPQLTVRRLLRDGTPAPATVLEARQTGIQSRGLEGRRRQLCCQLEVHPPGGEPYRAQAIQFILEAEEAALQPGAAVDIRYDPARPARVAIVRPLVRRPSGT